MKIGQKSNQGTFNSNAWVRVYSNTLSSAITSLTIDGINGNEFVNSNFERWSAGTNVPPDGWVSWESGGTPTHAREATIIKVGAYSYKTVAGASGEGIYYNLNHKLPYLRGKTITMGCWVYATVANVGCISIADSTGKSYSSYHTGDSTWQWLTVTRTIDVDTAAVYLYCQSVAAGTIYFDGAICMESSSVPQTTNANIDRYCLNGDVCGELKLYARVVGAANAESYLRINNDSGSNYGRQMLYAYSSTAAAHRAVYDRVQLVSANTGTCGQGESLIYAKSGYVRTLLNNIVSNVDGTTINSIGIRGHSWNNTTDNITSLLVYSDVTNGLGVGTVVELWRPVMSS